MDVVGDGLLLLAVPGQMLDCYHNISYGKIQIYYEIKAGVGFDDAELLIVSDVGGRSGERSRKGGRVRFGWMERIGGRGDGDGEQELEPGSKKEQEGAAEERDSDGNIELNRYESLIPAEPSLAETFSV